MPHTSTRSPSSNHSCKPSSPRSKAVIRALTVVAVLASAACGGAQATERTVILNRGSDTMINVAQGWAEAYARVEPGVSVEVAGGGSGVGIAALIDGTVHMANSSRQLKPEEIA